MSKLFCTSILSLLVVQAATASKAGAQDTRSQDTQSTSLINIRVSRTTEAVNYRDRTSTRIDFRGTPLMARVEGKAEIEAKNGRIAIKAEFAALSRRPLLAPRT